MARMYFLEIEMQGAMQVKRIFQMFHLYLLHQPHVPELKGGFLNVVLKQKKLLKRIARAAEECSYMNGV